MVLFICAEFDFINFECKLKCICLSPQTCFVDCLIEQTHPEIRKRDDSDVSISLLNINNMYLLFILRI